MLGREDECTIENHHVRMLGPPPAAAILNNRHAGTLGNTCELRLA